MHPLLINIMQLMCTQGYLRQVTAFNATSRELSEAAPLGTAKQIYEASRNGCDAALATYLAYWEGNSESWIVLNWVSADGLTCLQAAVRHNRLSCVRLLAATGAVDVNMSVEDGLTALHLACRLGLAAIVRVLGAVPSVDLNCRGGSMHETPLHMAVKNGHAEVTELLLGNDSVVSLMRLTNFEGDSPMDLATSDALRNLLAKGNQRKMVLDAAGRELFRAALFGTPNLPTLVEKWSGIECVLNFICVDDIADNLIDDVMVVGMTPVMAACYGGRLDAARLLLATAGVDPLIIQEPYGRNIVMHAAQEGHFEVLRVVLAAVPNIDVNLINNNGETACCLASMSGHHECVLELLGVAGVNVNQLSHCDCPALVYAVLSGHIEVVTLLLAMPGIDFNFIGTKPGFVYTGQTPLDLARRPEPDGHAEIALLLEAAGAKTFDKLEEAFEVALEAEDTDEEKEA